MNYNAEFALDGLIFAESPRWVGGSLWFVDMFARRVYRWQPSRDATVVAEFTDDDPSGLGFLPDGTPLVAMMRRREVLALSPREHVYVDLKHVAGTYLNDMVVDDTGRLYVDSIVRRGLDDEDASDDCIILVRPDRQIEIATRELGRPNGLAITPNRSTLIVAQPPGHRIASMTIQPDGCLTDSSLFATTGGASPDGLCVDVEGAVWYGSSHSSEFIRIVPGGQVTHRVSVAPRMAVACVLGGDDRRTLFMTTSDVTTDQLLARKPMLLMGPGPETMKLADEAVQRVGAPKAFVEAATVDIPGAGWP
jgi:sugar lactone lactonase YvrE